MKYGHLSDTLISAAQNGSVVKGWTHDYYRYPARFSPKFVRQAISEFTEPGDRVLDPFVGGGTTLVEAYAAGRNAMGTDINSLAGFITRVKTTLLSEEDLLHVEEATEKVCLATLTNWGKLEIESEHYQRHLTTSETWRIRRFLEHATMIAKELPPQANDFLKLVALRTGQWAFDNRKTIPTLDQARLQFQMNSKKMIAGMKDYREAISIQGVTYKPKFIQTPATEIHLDKRIKSFAPKLILTSPPYPGVHMLYHRWQVKGRRETAFPYWLANSRDGQTASYYNLGSRHESGLRTYFAGIQTCFKAVASLCNRDTIIVQMLAFSEPDWQLDEYLKAMQRAGLEQLIPEQGHLCRTVPNRKWYTNVTSSENTKKEYVLLHRLSE